jgi:GT2 family glycosyltransferase
VSSPGNISVIIITHDSDAVLPECLRALSVCSLADQLELIVVDNGSKTDPAAAVTAVFPQAVMILNKRNRGFAAACNQGAERAGGEFVAFVNPDLIVDPDALEKLRDAVTGDEKAGMAGGRLRYEDGAFQPTCRNFPTAWNLLFSRGSVPARFTTGRSAESVYTLPDYSETTEVPATAATLALIRREAWERMGGFDTRFFMYVEDTDLCYRLQLTGFRNLFVPAAGGVHRWGTGAGHGRIWRSRHHHLSMWKYFLKHQANGFSLIILPVFLLANFLLGIVIGGKGRPS